jgi:hypothetical protein
MEYGLVMRVVQVDDYGLLSVLVDVTSRGFRGSSQLYTTASALEELSADLQCFPEDASQSLEFELGTQELGYLGLTFSVLNAVGRCKCQVRLASNYAPTPGLESKNRIDVDMGVEPNAIDRFVSDLKNLHNNQAREAVLEGIDIY